MQFDDCIWAPLAVADPHNIVVGTETETKLKLIHPSVCRNGATIDISNSNGLFLSTSASRAAAVGHLTPLLLFSKWVLIAVHNLHIVVLLFIK